MCTDARNARATSAGWIACKGWAGRGRQQRAPLFLRCCGLPRNTGRALDCTMADTRLIERWLPISALGIESTRERMPMKPFPAPNRLHVWWARRPLVAARAAVLGSLLRADADRERFLHVLGIHGDPVATRRRIDAAKRSKENLGPNPFGYKRAFAYTPTADDRQWIGRLAGSVSPALTILDPTAGGGSIPIEMGAARLRRRPQPVFAAAARQEAVGSVNAWSW